MIYHLKIEKRAIKEVFDCYTINYINYSHHGIYGESMPTTTIQVEVEVRDLLKSFGSKGDTYNEIILDIIQRSRYVEYMKETYEILDNEEDWVDLDEL